MWRNLVILLPMLIFTVGCGKNNNFYQQGFNQAPNPYNNPGFPGGGGFPYPGQPGYPTNGGGFAPQLPVGYGNGYTPFLPVDNYMRQDPYRNQQWQQLWNGWQQYTRQSGVNPYNFQHFWYDYCPYRYQNQMPSWYRHFNNSYYGWMGRNTQLPQNPQPGRFWGHFQGLPLAW